MKLKEHLFTHYIQTQNNVAKITNFRKFVQRRTDKHQARVQVLEAATPTLDTRRTLTFHRCQFSPSYLVTQNTENPLHCT